MQTVKLSPGDFLDLPYNGDLVNSLFELGLELPKLGKIIGYGSEGEVYEYGPGKVIKIGSSGSSDTIREMINVLTQVKASHKFGCLAKVLEFDVLYKIVDEEAGTIDYIYYIVTERMEKSSRDVVSEDLVSDVNYVLSRCSNPSTTSKALERAEGLVQKDPDLSDNLVRFVKCIQKTKFRSTDLHVDNVMVDSSGNFKVVDYGFTKALPPVNLVRTSSRRRRGNNRRPIRVKMVARQTCAYLPDGTKIVIRRQGKRAWLERQRQDTLKVQ